MLRIAICDDEAPMRQHIKKCLVEYSMLRNLEFKCDLFSTGIDFLKAVDPYHLIIMDYQLHVDKQHINGLSIANKYRSVGGDATIIFLTSFPKVVFSSFEVNTFRFLTKPLNVDKLYAALDDYLKTLETDHTLFIRLERETQIISTKHTLYLEANGKYCTLFMIGEPKKWECHETLAQVEARLPQDFFMRCHRSYIVNLKYVNSYNHQEVCLRDGSSVYMSRSKYEAFNDAIINYSKRYGY